MMTKFVSKLTIIVTIIGLCQCVMEAQEISELAQGRKFRPLVDSIITVANVVNNITDTIEQFIDDREEDLDNLVSQWREDFPVFNILYIFTEMNLANYETIRSFLQIFDFVEAFFRAAINSVEDINKFLVAINLDPII